MSFICLQTKNNYREMALFWQRLRTVQPSPAAMRTGTEASKTETVSCTFRVGRPVCSHFRSI